MRDVIVGAHVANTVLRLAKAAGEKINPIKLNRLVYLVVCGYYQKTGVRLLTEDFEVWNNGPVLPSVHAKFGCYRNRPIRNYATDAVGRASFLDVKSDMAFRHVMSDISARFLRMDARSLCELTRMRSSAWYRAFQARRETLDWNEIKSDPCYETGLRN